MRRRTELCLIDSLTCFSVGRSLKHFTPTAVVARRMFTPDPEPGQSERQLSAFAVAYLYGQAANSLDYDDTLIGHPGAPIVGAVLAIASRERLPLDRLLRGIAAGYEAHWFLAAASLPSPERGEQIRSVGVWDTVAAAIGVSVALDLQQPALNRVIGVATSHSLLPYTGKWYERPVPALKNNLGWAACGAVLSVDLAQEGQTGVTNPLEGDTGMWRMAGSDQWQHKQVQDLKPGVLRVGFKEYPACWHIQEYLKSMSDALATVRPDDEIVEVTASGPREMEKFCDNTIATPADVAFSLPATFSLLISDVEPGPLWDDVDNDSEELRHRGLFRFQRSETRSVGVRTRSGKVVDIKVETSDRYNPAPWGLDEPGVLKKHVRLTDTDLQYGPAVAGEAASPEDSLRDASRLYDAIHRTMLSPTHA